MSNVSTKMLQAASGAENGRTIIYATGRSSPGSIVSIDPSDPSSLSLLDSIPPNATDIVLDLESLTAYASYPPANKIYSYSIEDPTNLVELGQISDVAFSTSEGLALDAVNKVLYYACTNGTSGNLASIDVSVPSSMVILDKYDGAGIDSYSTKIALDSTNKIIYLTSQVAGDFHSLSVSDPNNISFLGKLSYSLFAGIFDVALDTANQVAYVAAVDSDALVSVDISNPSNLVVLGAVSTGVNLNGARCVALDLDNQIAYVGCFTYVTAVNISNPSSLTVISSSTSSTSFISTATSIELDLKKGVAYVTSENLDAVTSVDISNPSSLTYLDVFTSSLLNNANSLALSIDGPAATNSYT